MTSTKRDCANRLRNRQPLLAIALAIALGLLCGALHNRSAQADEKAADGQAQLSDPCRRDASCKSADQAEFEPPPAPLLPTPSVTERRPVYKKWWFWTLVASSAAVVAGGIAGGILGAQKSATVPVVPTAADAYRPMF